MLTPDYQEVWCPKMRDRGRINDEWMKQKRMVEDAGEV